MANLKQKHVTEVSFPHLTLTFWSNGFKTKPLQPIFIFQNPALVKITDYCKIKALLFYYSDI